MEKNPESETGVAHGVHLEPNTDKGINQVSEKSEHMALRLHQKGKKFLVINWPRKPADTHCYL